MIRSELFKIRHHRTPWVLTALLAVGLSAGPIVMMFRQPDFTDQYTNILTAVFAVAALIVGAVFGGWIFGHEYRQGTVQRMFSLDASRMKLFAVKAFVGAVVLAAALAAAAGFGIATTWAAAAVNGDTFGWDGLATTMLGTSLVAFVVAGLAYASSVIFRNDTYAMLVPIGLVMVFQPLLVLIPGIGDYLIGSTAWVVADHIAGVADPGAMSAATATAWTVAWLGGLAATGSALLLRRDV